MKSKLSYWFKIFFINLLVLLSALFFLELIFRYGYYSKEQRKLGPQAIYEQYKNITFESKGFCKGSSTFLSHPFFAFTLNKNNDCYTGRINKIGFQDFKEFPLEKDQKYFDILVLGGGRSLLT